MVWLPKAPLPPEFLMLLPSELKGHRVWNRDRMEADGKEQGKVISIKFRDVCWQSRIHAILLDNINGKDR